MRVEIVLAICSLACFSITYLFKVATKYAKMDFSTSFFFNQDDYENKNAYAQSMARGIRTLGLYMINCTFIFIMCSLANTVNHYIFAVLFLATTCTLWYATMSKQLELIQKKSIE